MGFITDTTEWMPSVRILIDSTCCQIWKNSLLASQLRPCLRIPVSNYLRFLTCMGTQTKNLAFCLGTRSAIRDCRYNRFSLPNICPLFVILWSLNPVTSARSKCRQRIKEMIYPRKAALELWFINGPILHIAIHWKLVFSKMLSLMIRESNDMARNFMDPKFTAKLDRRCLLVSMPS